VGNGEFISPVVFSNAHGNEGLFGFLLVKFLLSLLLCHMCVYLDRIERSDLMPKSILL